MVLVLATAVIFGFLYFQKGPVPGDNDGGGTNFFAPFNRPGQQSKPPVKPPVEIPENQPPVGEEVSTAKLKKVSSMPVAGFGLFNKERLKEIAPPLIPPQQGGEIIQSPTASGGTGGLKTKAPPTEFATAVRYVEKAAGIIYQTFADKIDEKKFSMATIPKVYDAYFGNNGESVIMRHLKIDEQTIETFAGTLPKEYLGTDPNTNNEIKGSFLPENIRDLSLSPDGSKIFYLFDSRSTLGDSLVGTILNLATNKKVQIFDSPFTEWLSQWPNNNIISLSTKPSAGIPGYMYTMDSGGRNLSKILGNINGLTTLGSPNGKLILYGDNSLSLYLHHTDTGNSDLIGVRTLPEKCTWNKMSDAIYCAVPKSIDTSGYPDVWYRGETSFNDQLWKIDIKTGNTTIIGDPATVTGEEVDGTKLSLDNSENYLFFINKKDSYLWGLNLK